MKKTLTIFIALLIGLAFNQTALANKECVAEYWPKRCKVEYTRLDAITGKTKSKKNTSQFYTERYGEEGAIRLTKKIERWLSKKETNIITKLKVFKCKRRNAQSIWTGLIGWGPYRECPERYKESIINVLKDNYPNQADL